MCTNFIFIVNQLKIAMNEMFIIIILWWERERERERDKRPKALYSQLDARTLSLTYVAEDLCLPPPPPGGDVRDVVYNATHTSNRSVEQYPATAFLWSVPACPS